MTNPKIEHITILTGASRLSPRSEVAPTVIAQIRQRLHNGSGALWDGWSVRQITPTPAGCWVYDLSHGGERIAACWLCSDRASSETLWDIASRSGIGAGVRLHRPVHTPWLAAQLTIPPARIMDPRYQTVVYDCADVERCVAWALMPDK